MFDSEYCTVDYIQNDNVVFLSWKKFCCGDDYRNPVKHALELLNCYEESNMIVDARNGFEDDKEDVEWGFSYFIPNMAKTDCKYLFFIMNKENDIDGEIDMWTKEFMKHFTVVAVDSYNEAIDILNT